MQTLCDILERVRRDDRKDLLRARPAPGKPFESVSAADWLRGVELCAAGFAHLGIGRGDRVGLICSNRPEWHVVDFACHRLGAALVPLFPTLVPDQIAYCFSDAACAIAVVEGQEQLDKMLAACPGVASLRTVVVVGDFEPPVEYPGVAVVPLVDVLQPATSDIEIPGPEGPDALATIIYTSGTTGPPKGVMLTHCNLLANIEGLQQAEPVVANDCCLSLLPLCHAYERALDYSYLAAGARIAYGSPDSVSADFKAIRPTVMVGVPRLFQKLQSAIEHRIEEASDFRRALYRRALASGEMRARARLGVGREGLANKLIFPLLDLVILSKIRDVAGGRIRVFSCGGAPLDASLNWWFLSIGWNLVQGYGLTETSPIVSTNRVVDNRIGTVGRPLFNVEVRIAEDGEVLARGPNVMAGYWRRVDATAEVLIDGWLHTGDVGEIDADGFLSITDRKKSILVTSTGKKVAPQPLESALLASPWIDQVIAVGDGRRFVAALIVPNWRRLERWAATHDLAQERQLLCEAPQVKELIEGEMSRYQGAFAEYERARQFRILAEPFTPANGQLTPTLKPIRQRIERDYAALIEEMYAEH